MCLQGSSTDKSVTHSDTHTDVCMRRAGVEMIRNSYRKASRADRGQEGGIDRTIGGSEKKN